MNVRRLRTLSVEIYKTLNDLNPSFMNNVFKLNQEWNQKTFGYKNRKALGPKIWNNLPYHVKSSENLDTFKNLLKIGMETL